MVVRVALEVRLGSVALEVRFGSESHCKRDRSRGRDRLSEVAARVCRAMGLEVIAALRTRLGVKRTGGKV